MLKKEFFIKNRKALLAKVPKNSIIVIASNGLLQRTADNNYPFFQDSNFYYLSGINIPNCFIIVDSQNQTDYFCYNQKSKIEILFDGDYDFSSISDLSGINNFINTVKAFEFLKENSKSKKIYYNYNKKQSYIFNNPYNALIHKKLAQRMIKTKNVSELLAGLRSLKQKEEIALIQKAVFHTKKAIEMVATNLTLIKSESQVANIINNYFIANGLMHAYEPMVAAGKSATTAHYISNNKLIKQNSFVLLDIGAEIEHYCADISRTFLNSNDSLYKNLILELTLVQKQLIGFIKPGVLFKEIHAHAVELIGDLLLNNGLIKDKKETTQCFPYAIGHFLGLDVHDVGDYTKPLKPNMIITIEPGIHIPKKNIGIRIEDDILITKDGARVL